MKALMLIRGGKALVYEITEMRTGPNLKSSNMAAMKSNAPHE